SSIGAKTKKGFGNVAQKFLLIFIYSVSDFFFIFNDNLSTYSGAKHCYYTGKCTKNQKRHT
ncbi:MAG: hypothetical protein E7F28_15790, partial [Enterococcus faecalis]|nr:hypothetical protein [Enterococcus faecalis]